ncbi:sugar O-acetyltransferase [Bifidobacterium oedipodis]|uniref:Acetyltransferase n=1 Tax=Bifidobacterium oedipodis TaxID=2675322 RepID=A0A7Y0EMM3_9BIFI|nr:sugar O-acetyltransferase [Bifidobacterium sp. DSM 109957]NMM93021.1 galactoside O-acetyltransferase [Bifidobacterium sp. DSM 109957]
MTTQSTPEYANQRERMLAGELYVANDPQLQELNMRKRRLVHAINNSAYDAFDERKALFTELFGAFGEGGFIEPPFNCDYGCNITVGKNFYANMDCIFLDVAPITIGDRVFFGPRVNLLTPYHPIDADVRSSGPEGALPITIGDDVWFGGNVTVCPGVTIGSDVVIGAGSVVVKDIPSHSVAVGNPCRVVREIGDTDREYWERKAAEYHAWKDAVTHAGKSED